MTCHAALICWVKLLSNPRVKEDPTQRTPQPGPGLALLGVGVWGPGTMSGCPVNDQEGSSDAAEAARKDIPARGKGSIL